MYYVSVSVKMHYIIIWSISPLRWPKCSSELSFSLFAVGSCCSNTPYWCPCSTSGFFSSSINYTSCYTNCYTSSSHATTGQYLLASSCIIIVCQYLLLRYLDSVRSVIGICIATDLSNLCLLVHSRNSPYDCLK